jgi:hypothetical protein
MTISTASTRAWNNMLTPVNRVDHQTLLDTLVMYWMYQMGVDRLHLVSEKYLRQGKAVMEIDCDRANPLADQFTVTVLDDHGRTLRRERYSRTEVEQSVEILSNGPQVSMVLTSGPAKETATHSTTRPSTAVPTTEEVESPQQKRQRLERDRRIKAVEASTQPARVGKGTGSE